MDEDDLFAGSMEIDDPASGPGPVPGGPGSSGHFVAVGRGGVDEDMSEVAEIMLNLKVGISSAPHTHSLCCMGQRIPHRSGLQSLVAAQLCHSAGAGSRLCSRWA